MGLEAEGFDEKQRRFSLEQVHSCVELTQFAPSSMLHSLAI